MANTIAKSCTVQTKVARFNRPALCFFLFFLFFIFFAKGKENSVLDFSRGYNNDRRKRKQCAGFFRGYIYREYPLDWKSSFSCQPAPFFFQIKKNAVTWPVEPGQKRLNPVRIGYIDIKRYFRAIYLHKWVRE